MRRFIPFWFFASVLYMLFSSPAFPQGATTASSDPQAVALATQALTALGTAQVSDVTLTGSVTRSIGPDVETGSFTLKALGLVQSRMDLSFSSGPVTEIRTIANGTPQGMWLEGGTVHPAANHNCFTDAAWFFPALSILNGPIFNANSVVTYIGLETRAGRSVQHLHYFVQGAVSDPTGLVQRLSAEDIYLDSSSLLLVSLVFNEHPDANAAVNTPVEIDYSDYRSINGINLPFRIRKSFNGSLLLDLTVQSAALNSGLSNSVFTAQ